MSMILVVEPDRSFAEQLADALHNAGWTTQMAGGRTQAIALMAEQQPEVVIVDIAVPEAEELLAACAAGRGGPGSIAVVPAPLAGAVSADDYRADAIITKPFSDDQLNRAIEACVLLRKQRRATPASGNKERHLSSQDIFGDILAEVESSVAEKPARRAVQGKQAPDGSPGTDAKPTTPPAQHDPAATMVMPTLSSPPPRISDPVAVQPQPAPPRATSVAPTPPVVQRAAAKPAGDDLEERLQKTLSGLLDPRMASKPKGKSPAESAENLDDLLDRTLGPLVQVKRNRPSAPSEPPRPPVTPVVPTPPVASVPAAIPAGEAATLPQIEPLVDPIAGNSPIGDSLASRAADPGSLEASATSTSPTDHSLSAGGTPSIPEPPAIDPEGMDSAAFPRVDDAQPLSTDTEADAPASDEASGGSPLAASSASTPGSLAGVDAASLTTPASMDAQPDPYRTQLLPTVKNMPADSGQILGDYTLIERIAVGGMAEVWKARRRGVEGFEKIVAIKRILAHLTDSPELVSMLIDEAKLAARLSNPNIVQIYDLGKVEDDFFIAMEYVDGTDLRTALKAGREHDLPMPVGVAIMATAQLARALDYAHRLKGDDQRELGLIHRDVSPQNVLISNEGDIKLCDFGIAKAVTSVGHTQMGALKGKLQYMSPEQAWGKKLDARSDIFSLGAVLFEVLTGTKLFSGDSEIGVLDAVRDCRITSPRAIDPDIPEEAERIVLRALAKVPEDRYQSAGALAAELEALLSSMPTKVTQAELAAYIAQVNAAQPSGDGTDAVSPLEASAASAVIETASITDDVAPAEEDAFDALAEDDRASSRRGRWLLIAAVIALMILGGLWLFIFGRSAPVTPGTVSPGTASSGAAGSEPASSTPAAPIPTSDGVGDVTPTQAEGQPLDASAAADEAGVGSAPETSPARATGQGAGSPGTQESATEPSAGAAAGDDSSSAAGESVPTDAAGVDLEKMVAEELARRTADIEAKMQAEYQREQERLAAELAEAQARNSDLDEAPDEPATESDSPPPNSGEI